MKFLAIDTSGHRLCVVAVNGEKQIKRTKCDIAQQYSTRLMGEIEEALREAELTPAECDFFACVVGPGSFTGIRIGIATVKGLCFGLEKPALSVTSFDSLAYSEGEKKLVALIPAGHGNYYACGYEGLKITAEPAFVSGEQAEALLQEGYAPVTRDGGMGKEGDEAEGLLRACLAKSGEAGAPSALVALYLQKSSAERNL